MIWAASVQGAGAGDRFRVIPVHIAITVLGLEGSSNVNRDHHAQEGYFMRILDDSHSLKGI